MTDITKATHVNMQEKLAWAERCFARMTDVMDKEPDLVQDHFWSFLHAIHLLWFYFGRWVKECRPRSSAKGLSKDWKAKHLSPEEIKAWDSLGSLRNEDAHVQPVVPKKPEGPHLLVNRKTGRILISAKTGKLLIKTKPFRVIQEGIEVELVPVCENGLAAFKKFVQNFDGIK